MALTFPSSPSNGQYYTDTATGNRYVYNSSVGAWIIAANNVGMSVSSTPPGNVAPGALWYNREIGRTFLYYDDGDSKQWVETVPATGFFDSSTVASYANVAAQIYLTPAYNTANAAYAAANNVGPQIAPTFNTANAAYNTANVVYNQSNVVFGTVNASFGKANTALQNTSGTFAGNLTITGNLTASSITTAPANGAYSIEYVIVGGGGAGAYRYGGGGAGGYLSSVQGESSGGGHPAYPVMWVTSGSTFTVTVGAGAPAQTSSPPAHGANGSNSVFGSLVAYGGGGGSGGGTSSASDPLMAGWSGGSGGGACGDGYGGGNVYTKGGTGYYKQGYEGGNGWCQSGNNSGGGGGGAGQRGEHAYKPDWPASGGIGVATNISGTITYYAGGGAGMSQSGYYGLGGRGGGGNYRTNGGTNTGGGGGNGYDSTSGGGGSGIVIVRYANATQRGTGGTVTSASINGVTYWIHTFTSSGTFTA